MFIEADDGMFHYDGHADFRAGAQAVLLAAEFGFALLAFFPHLRDFCKRRMYRLQVKPVSLRQRSYALHVFAVRPVAENAVPADFRRRFDEFVLGYALPRVA